MTYTSNTYYASSFSFKISSSYLWGSFQDAVFKEVRYTDLCRTIAEDACCSLPVLLGMFCFHVFAARVARTLLADVLLQKQILLLKQPWG